MNAQTKEAIGGELVKAADAWNVPQVAPSAEVEAMLALIERVARDPQSDIDKLERLVAMRERLEAREAERRFADAMAAAQAEIPVVLKNKANTQTNSNYANLEQIAKAIMPVITRHGFSVSFGMDEPKQPDCYGITAIVTNGGHSRNYRADVPIDIAGAKGAVNKTRTHAFGSTTSYGRRYLLCMIFNVATADDDGNAASRDKEADRTTITDEQVMKLRDLLEATDSDEKKLLEYLKLESLDDIPAKKFEWVLGLIKQSAERQ